MDAKSKSKIWKHQMKNKADVLIFLLQFKTLRGSVMAVIFVGTDLETKRENFDVFDKKL